MDIPFSRWSRLRHAAHGPLSLHTDKTGAPARPYAVTRYLPWLKRAMEGKPIAADGSNITGDPRILVQRLQLNPEASGVLDIQVAPWCMGLNLLSRITLPFSAEPFSFLQRSYSVGKSTSSAVATARGHSRAAMDSRSTELSKTPSN